MEATAKDFAEARPGVHDTIGREREEHIQQEIQRLLFREQDALRKLSIGEAIQYNAQRLRLQRQAGAYRLSRIVSNVLTESPVENGTIRG